VLHLRVRVRVRVRVRGVSSFDPMLHLVMPLEHECRDISIHEAKGAQDLRVRVIGLWGYRVMGL